ncbi:hypothetical protein ACFQY0_01340 [Haloferula chungangensis]|uniref:Uncharacterized protein n=1 Tax=Haloferula chungangensis TaxID=1048331 RepID=A0ABW2L0E2_9BACT
MKAILTSFLLSATLLGAKLDVKEPTGEAFKSSMQVVMLEEASYSDVLEFLRAKATEFLRDEIPSDPAVFVFEYRFDPMIDNLGAKLHSKLNYNAKDVTVEQALEAILPRFGLAFEITSPTQVVISDRVAKEE